MPKIGRNQEDIQQANRLAVLRMIHRLHRCSRAELARRTGLTKATITGIVQSLISAGLVRETGLMDSHVGRRSMGLMLCHEQYLCIGLRLTRRHIRGGLYDVSGELHELRECRIEAGTNVDEAMAAMGDIVQCLLDTAGSRRVLGIGIAAPGPIVQSEGKILYMSAFPGWENVAIPETLNTRFNLPVYIEHDGVCAALSEWWSRPPEAEYRMMLCVLAGQGIGAGFLVDGLPVRGAMGCAGEIGHMSVNIFGPKCSCGNYGCLENYVSTLALEREVNEAICKDMAHPSYGKHVTVREALQLVKSGDPLVCSLYEKEIEYLAGSIVNLINILNPDYVMITDELAICDEKMRAIVERVVAERCSARIRNNLKISVKYGSSYKALQAAASLPLDHYLQQIGAQRM